MRIPTALRLLGAATSLVCATAVAHFPFLLPDRAGVSATLIMSETLEPDDRVELSLLKDARLVLVNADGSEYPLGAPSPADDGASLRMPIPGSGTRVLAGDIDLGIMQRGTGPAHVLVYYPKTIVGDPFAPSTRLQGRAPIEIVPERTERGAVLRLLVDDAPLARSAMRIIGPDGSDVEVMTDDAGRTQVLVAAGRYGAWARHWTDEAGERNGRAYVQVRRYATLVVDLPGSERPPEPTPGSAAVAPAPQGAVVVSSLPRAIASFGATVLDGVLYVYGGHTGARHDYSTATVSGRFSRLALSGLPHEAPRWEELPGGVSAQGLGIVPYGNAIIRAGGMEPRNAVGRKADNHSLAEVAIYRIGASAWASMQPLPEPRSSHDLVVAGDALVVVGGWRMSGADAAPVWLDDALILDLTSEGGDWERVPQPFRRRALVAAALGAEVYVLGGFDEQDTPKLDVDVLDLRTRTWRSGPSIPGGGRNGFAPAACVHEGDLYVSVGSGEIHRLSDDRTEWELFALATPRIVHRLVAHGDGILVIGGAREAAMTDLIEAVAVRGPIASSDSTPPSASLPAVAARAHWTHPEPERIAAAMDRVDDAFDSLLQLEATGWKNAVAESRDTAIGEVDRLLGHLAEVRAMSSEAPDGFRAMLDANVDRTERLKARLRMSVVDQGDLSLHLAEVRATCTACHRAYR